ncbi:VOC family protein [Fulvivirga maritima]|uniref:VOC family protein n=1 Tax=Fulvivirga maritima TaxID=2904247 RepID=UPI001F18196B|nr:VOC family protein [Fulvivirga maritima]UII25169.1 VOC family protein [Fulvivirga maritima]
MLGLRTTIYKVPDISAAKEWYCKAFKAVPYFDQPFYVGFNIGGFELGLMPYEGEVKTGNTVVSYWGVINIKEQYERLIELGATGYEAPEQVGDDIITATIKDPWDNVIGLIYNPNFKPGP